MSHFWEMEVRTQEKFVVNFINQYYLDNPLQPKRAKKNVVIYPTIIFNQPPEESIPYHSIGWYADVHVNQLVNESKIDYVDERVEMVRIDLNQTEFERIFIRGYALSYYEDYCLQLKDEIERNFTLYSQDLSNEVKPPVSQIQKAEKVDRPWTNERISETDKIVLDIYYENYDHSKDPYGEIRKETGYGNGYIDTILSRNRQQFTPDWVPYRQDWRGRRWEKEKQFKKH